MSETVTNKRKLRFSDDERLEKRRMNDNGEETNVYKLNQMDERMTEKTHKYLSMFPTAIQEAMMNGLKGLIPPISQQEYINAYDQYHNTPGLFQEINVHPYTAFGYSLSSDPTDH